MERRVGTALVVLFLLPALVACGGGGAPTPQRPVEPASPPPPQPAAELTPEPMPGTGTDATSAPAAVPPAPPQPVPAPEPSPDAKSATPAATSEATAKPATPAAKPATPAAKSATPAAESATPAAKPAVVDPGGRVEVAPPVAGVTRIGAAQCRMCHKIQHDSWSPSAHARRDPPLDCEGCHGPGSAYKSMAVMKDPAKARAAGLVMPAKEFCATCHRSGWTDAMLTAVHAHKPR